MSAPRAAIPSDIDPIPPVAAVARPELTFRAVLAGALIGVVLAAGNVYTAIKVSVIDGGSITAALVAFGIFAAFRRAGRTAYGPLETNITQTVASSAAVMSFVTGVMGPIPALDLMGLHVSAIAVALYGIAIGLLGIFVAALVRRRLIVDEALPFPTGLTTGEVIETMFTAREAARRRLVLLATAAALAATIFWFREARPTLIPQAFMLGGTIAGFSAAALGAGFSCSPLMVSIGIMIGLRGCVGMLVGSIISRIVLAPWLTHAGIIGGVDLSAANQWLVWPTLGLLLAGSFLPLLLDGGALVRGFRQLVLSLARRPGIGPASADSVLTPRLWAPLLAASLIVILVVGWLAFQMSPLVALAALVLALVFANVTARATGETDWSPGGPIGTISLMLLGGRGTTGAMMGGGASLGMVSETAQTLWAFRAGHHLGASPRAQIGAQILGMVVGALVSVPVYAVIVSTYGLANEAMPAISAVTFKATAEAMKGLAALPRWGVPAVAIGAGTGAVLTLMGRLRIGRILPSAAAVGVGFMLPLSLTVTALAGALLALAARRLFRGLDQQTLLAVAAGGMTGESIMGVVIAILTATGVL